MVRNPIQLSEPTPPLQHPAQQAGGNSFLNYYI